MLQLKNQTPFAAQIMLLPDRSGIDTLFAVIKATFTIAESLRLSDEQVPLTLADEFHGEPATSGIRAASDVCIGKLGTDIIINGSAWAPSERPTWQMEVAASVGPASKRVRVCGDRVWDTSGAGAAVSWLAPFVRMPLVWERAFGGSDLTDKGPATEPRNPAGLGFRLADSTKPLAGLPLPNIENPKALIASWKDTPSPAGFGAVAAHWLPRRAYAGTYDDAWMKNRAPYLPDDFDLRFCQLASAGLVTQGYLQGGELVELHGMTASGVLRFSLPIVGISVNYRLNNDSLERLASLDTVVIEPDAGRLIMLWRSALACDKRARQIREVVPMLVPGGQARAA
jgi:hypothetical protein